MTILEYLDIQKQHRKLTQEFARGLEPYELTPMEAVVLHYADGRSMGEIAGELHVTLPNVTALSKELFKAGYVTLAQLNPRDRRMRHLKLTPKGRQVLAKLEGVDG